MFSDIITRKDFIGNNAALEQLKEALQNGNKRILLHGALGVGKSTAVKVIAHELALKLEVTDDPLRVDADREKDMSGKRMIYLVPNVESHLSGGKVAQALKGKTATFIFTCNDKSAKGIADLKCYGILFKRPTSAEIQKFCKAKKLSVTQEMLTKANGDMRKLMTMIKYGLGDKSDVFEKDWWSITGKLLKGDYYDDQSQFNLQHYFADNFMIPLMVQENYVKIPEPDVIIAEKSLRKSNGLELEKKKENELMKLRHMELLARTADVISEAELATPDVNSFALMPSHGMMSCIYPAKLIHGQQPFGMLTFPKSVANFSGNKKLKLDGLTNVFEKGKEKKVVKKKKVDEDGFKKVALKKPVKKSTKKAVK